MTLLGLRDAAIFLAVCLVTLVAGVAWAAFKEWRRSRVDIETELGHNTTTDRKEWSP